MVYLALPIKNGWIFNGYVSHNQRVIHPVSSEETSTATEPPSPSSSWSCGKALNTEELMVFPPRGCAWAHGAHGAHGLLDLQVIPTYSHNGKP
jgi:hypothetical protein